MLRFTKKIAVVSCAALMTVAGTLTFAACSDADYSSRFDDLEDKLGDLSSQISNLESKLEALDGSEENNEEEGGQKVEVNVDYSGLSGEITVYMPSPTDLAQELCDGFEELTGVTVNLWTGTTGQITAKLTAEEANPQADVVILASWSDGLSLKADGKLLAYESPYAQYMHEGFVDDDYTLYGTSASAVGVIYNTNYYTNLNEDWAGFSKKGYQDDIAIPDPTSSGACKDFVSGFVTALDNDYSIIDSWVANGLTNGGGNSPALNMVKRGEKAILIAGVDYNAYSAIASGEDIAIYYPESGTVINPRPAMIMKTAPHVDNAKAFINYLMSDEAQQLVADAYLIPGRADVECNSARLGYDEIKQYTVDWAKMMEIADEAAAYVVAQTAGNI